MNIFLVCTLDDKNLMTIQKAFLSKHQATKWMEGAAQVFKIMNKVDLQIIEHEIEDFHGIKEREIKNDV